MATWSGVPVEVRLEEVKAELLKSLNYIKSKVDINVWLDFWFKWRLPITAACGNLTLTFIMLNACRSMSRRLKQRRLQFLIDEKQCERANIVDQLHKRLQMSASTDAIGKRREIVLLNFEEL